MNRKLTEEDREEIHSMLRMGDTHEDIARRFDVCKRTIDREAEWLRAHSVTVRTIPMIAGGSITSITIGEAIETNPDMLRELTEEADRLAAQFETEEFKAEMARIEAEAERIMKELEAAYIDFRGWPTIDERRAGGIPAPPGPSASLRASTGRGREHGGVFRIFRTFPTRLGG